jgi:hypothetical protein
MSASERSALRAGFDAETYFCDTAVFQQQDLQFLPYAQTDFRGRGSIGGFDALWEPYYINDGINLGGRLDVLTPKTVGYYFRLIGEANVFRVNDPGLTNFLPHTNYALIGGNAELRAVLFENDPSVGAALCGTISFIGSTKYLWDAVSQKPIYQLGAEVDYRLGGKSASTANCPNPSIGNGSTSIALSYNKGTDPMTFVKQDVYKASLKFAYADLDLDHVQPAAGATLTRDSTCQIHCAAVQPPRGKTGYPFVDGYQCVGDRLWHMSFCQGSQESPDAEEFHDRRCPNACTVEFRRCRSPGCQHADAGECYEGCVGVPSVPMRVETGMARSCAGIRCLGAASSARVLLREAPPSLG